MRSEQKLYVCEICKYGTNQEWLFIEHEHFHPENNGAVFND